MKLTPEQTSMTTEQKQSIDVTKVNGKPLKTCAQFARMTRRNQVEYLGTWFAEFRGALRVAFGTDPLPPFETIVETFEAIALTWYRDAGELLAAAVRSARTQRFDGHAPALGGGLDLWAMPSLTTCIQ